ncbi:MAG: class I SAM-dependent methyltransferase, partial [Lentisphaeria bacterium]|nr:class I SAM-dependent methyltransferase [Lentisphaeria bacterium]
MRGRYGSLRRMLWTVASSLTAASLFAAAGAVPGPGEAARALLAAGGVTGGLVVHVGCGEGELTVALRADGRFLVQGLDADPERVATARETIRAAGAYGPVSAMPWDGEHLPYADNLVNLLLVSVPDCRAAAGEFLRVLAPRGACLLLRDGNGDLLAGFGQPVDDAPLGYARV